MYDISPPGYRKKEIPYEDIAGKARRGWPRMDSPWAIPRAKLGWFGNDEKASCVTVSRRRSVLPSTPFLSSSSTSRPHLSSSSPCTDELGASIHLNIIISFRELGFQGIFIFFFFLSFSLFRYYDLIARSVRESSISLFPPLRKPPSTLPCPRDWSTRPRHQHPPPSGAPSLTDQ